MWLFVLDVLIRLYANALHNNYYLMLQIAAFSRYQSRSQDKIIQNRQHLTILWLVSRLDYYLSSYIMRSLIMFKYATYTCKTLLKLGQVVTSGKDITQKQSIFIARLYSTKTIILVCECILRNLDPVLRRRYIAQIRLRDQLLIPIITYIGYIYYSILIIEIRSFTSLNHLLILQFLNVLIDSSLIIQFK